MRHLTVTSYGCFIGIESRRLVVKEKDSVTKEYPISRLKSVIVSAGGVSFSSNLLFELAAHGVNFFLTDFRSIPVLSLSGMSGHAVVELRKKQFQFSETIQARELCKTLIYSKIKNQRAVLLYFSKSEKKNISVLEKSAESLKDIILDLKKSNFLETFNWRERLLGHEGGAAHIYWLALRESELFPPSFEKRKGRGATDVTNAALNLGYSILTSYIWNAVLKAGLEPYLGFLHVERPGKPSLILDLMEEYRPMVVDRSIIKLRHLLYRENFMTDEIKKRVIEEIHLSFSKIHEHRGKKLKLETLLQRQVYRLCGFLYGKKKYRPINFKW